MLKLIGLSDSGRRAVSSVIQREWRSLVGSLGLAIVLPVMELTLLTTIFAMLSPMHTSWPAQMAERSLRAIGHQQHKTGEMM